MEIMEQDSEFLARKCNAHLGTQLKIPILPCLNLRSPGAA